MYDDFWQDIIDIVWDAINNELNTQEEIDQIISDQFSVFAGYTDNQDTIPGDFKMRQREFDNPVNLMTWLQDGGVPVTAVYIWREDTPDGPYYHTFISAES